MQIYLMINDACNLNCTHCIRGDHAEQMLSVSEVERAISQMNDYYGSYDLILTGGEPTIHPDFIHILEFALNHVNGKVIINSNGTTRFYEEDILRYRHVKNLIVQFSIDGYGDSNDEIRGKDIFDKVMLNLAFVKRSGFNTFVSTAVNKYNIESLKKLTHELSRCRIDLWHVNAVLPFGHATLDECIDVEEWNELVEWLIDNACLRLRVKKLFDFSSLVKMSDKEIQTLSKRAIANCGSGKSKLYVTAGMDVLGCTCQKSLPVGNLRELSIFEILDNPDTRDVFSFELLDDSPCQKCPYKALCNGGCVGMSLTQKGVVGYGDERCPLFRILKEGGDIESYLHQYQL